MSTAALMAVPPFVAVQPGRRTAAFVAAVGVALLAACAEVPPTPSPVPVARVSPHDEHVQKAISRHLALAQQAKQSGDLASAAAQWQIVTALAPREDSYRRELADAQSAIKRRTREELAAGNAAMKSGDAERAADAMLRALALDPGNAEAAQALRDLERRRAARVQASRAARVSEAAASTSNGAARPAASARAPETNDAYSLEQPLEMLKAGDIAGGLRDLRRFVDANPNDKAARNRIGNVVYDKAKELENAGSREQALTLYEQAVALRGEAAPGWSARIQAVKKALADDYFEKGVAAYPRDKALAITQWETSLRYDPQNAKTMARLKEARATTHDTAARIAK
jgi:tetratricopeptide (TPR) repeat protein